MSDRPVFAKPKEVKMRYLLVFDRGNYVCLLGDLLKEQCLLVLHGELIKYSGLDSALSKADLSTSETSPIVDVNDLKRTRYCIQVTACSV